MRSTRPSAARRRAAAATASRSVASVSSWLGAATAAMLAARARPGSAQAATSRTEARRARADSDSRSTGAGPPNGSRLCVRRRRRARPAPPGGRGARRGRSGCRTRTRGGRRRSRRTSNASGSLVAARVAVRCAEQQHHAGARRDGLADGVRDARRAEEVLDRGDMTQPSSTAPDQRRIVAAPARTAPGSRANASSSVPSRLVVVSFPATSSIRATRTPRPRSARRPRVAASRRPSRSPAGSRRRLELALDVRAQGGHRGDDAAGAAHRGEARVGVEALHDVV